MGYEILYGRQRYEYMSFINADGLELALNPPNYLFIDSDVFGMAPATVQTGKAPYQDGETFIDQVFDKREFYVEFAILGTDRLKVLDSRANVLKKFNPRLGPGSLKWTRSDGAAYQLDCITKRISFPQRSAQSSYHQTVLVEMVAFKPFWYNPAEVQRTMVGFSGGWSFPLSLPISFGQVGSQVTVENEGDVKTPALIYLYGEVVNPVIKNLTTEQEIEIVGTVEDGEILIINTEFGEKGALILSGGEYINAFQYVDPESKFWQLEPGDNILGYTVSSEGENAKCIVMFYHRYSGV